MHSMNLLNYSQIGMNDSLIWMIKKIIGIGIKKCYMFYILLTQNPYFFCLPSFYLCTNQQTRQVCVLCFSVNLIMLEMQYKLFPTKWVLL